MPLVDVVQQVNANARDSLGATIKQIQVLDLAQWAINAANERGGQLWTPGKQGAGMGPEGMPGMDAAGAMPGMDAGAMPGMPGGGGADAAGMPGASGAADAGAAAASADAALLDGRYLDDQGKPMKGDGTGPYAEFKQMFVYMRFLMDQRKLPDLLAALRQRPLADRSPPSASPYWRSGQTSRRRRRGPRHDDARHGHGGRHAANDGRQRQG